MVFSKPDPTELLGNYLVALNLHPVRTKALTSAGFNGLSELIASVLAGEKDPTTGTYISPRVPKMAMYGFFVSGPLSHYLVDWLQRLFKGRKGAKWDLLQIVALNATVNPILNLTFLISMTIIAGARSWAEIKDRISKAYWPLLRSTWISSPLLIAFAQKYVPKVAWTPVFSFFAFLLSIYHNVVVKRRAAALRKSKKD